MSTPGMSTSAGAPLAPDAAFRAEVGAVRAAERRRTFPLRVHVGVPAGPRAVLEVPWPVPAAYDAGLRFDLLDALLHRWRQRGEAAAWGWVSRPGQPEPHDEDLAWYAVAAHVSEAHGLRLDGFRVVTRTGWLDLLTGDSRAWKRLRS